MSSWLLSIVGVVFVSVLFDLIYPNGKTNSLCKSIFGIISVFIIVSPLINIDINNIKFDSTVNQQLLDDINDNKLNSLEVKINKCLSDKGIVGVDVRISTYLSEKEFVVEKVYCDTTNLVITEKVTNINKYEVIINEISSLLNIEKERIVVYG